MSIKSDRWIRQMAQEHGMISPFEAGQVRVGEQGQKLVVSAVPLPLLPHRPDGSGDQEEQQAGPDF